MGADDVRRQLLAQVHLRFAIVGGVHFVLHDIELELIILRSLEPDDLRTVMIERGYWR